MKKLNILIADDHQLIIDGIHGLLNKVDHFVLHGATTPAEVRKQMASIKPDILLLDIEFNATIPEPVNGLDLAEELMADYPATRIFILTMHFVESYVNRTIELGLAGYLLKKVNKHELLEAIETVANGDHYYSKDIINLLADAQRRRIRAKAEPQPPHLTEREIEVLKHLAADMQAKEIAEALHITQNTVNAHKKSLLEKLGEFGVKSSLGLVRFAVENGYTFPPKKS